MAFTLPPLPYDAGALAESGMSRETLELHHGKHHQAYVTALNGFVESKGLAGKSLEDVVREAHGRDDLAGVFNNAGQHWNHALFWQCMQPQGGGESLPGRIGAKVEQDFGSVREFKEAFKQAGTTQFGSGWAWLVVDPSGKLKVCKTPNGSNPLATGEGTPLLGCDVWEHSYYVDFRNRRPDYLQNFLDRLVNWEFVEQTLEQGGMRSGQSA